MNPVAIVLLLIVLLLGAGRVDAQLAYACGTGTVDRATTVTESGRVPNLSAAEEAVQPEAPSAITARSTPTHHVVAVRFGDRLYIARAAVHLPWNFDPTTLEPHEPIAVCASHRDLVLDRLDGTDFRASVIRIERVSEPPE
jgi:hypothetical protein